MIFEGRENQGLCHKAWTLAPSLSLQASMSPTFILELPLSFFVYCKRSIANVFPLCISSSAKFVYHKTYYNKT